MKEELIDRLLSEVQSKIKYSENVASMYALAYAKSNKETDRNSCLASLREAEIWADVRKLINSVMYSA